MRNPAGRECAHYYQDYYRGREVQECRLLGREWEPRLCSACPVPDILRANGCPHMVLRASLKRRLWRRRVEVEAYCTQQDVEVENPYVGCGHCHPEAALILGER